MGSNVYYMALTAPSIYSTNGYTLGGAPINTDGSWGGEYTVMNSLNIVVPPITAIWLIPVSGVSPHYFSKRVPSIGANSLKE